MIMAFWLIWPPIFDRTTFGVTDPGTSQGCWEGGGGTFMFSFTPERAERVSCQCFILLHWFNWFMEGECMQIELLLSGGPGLAPSELAFCCSTHWPWPSPVPVDIRRHHNFNIRIVPARAQTSQITCTFSRTRVGSGHETMVRLCTCRQQRQMTLASVLNHRLFISTEITMHI